MKKLSCKVWTWAAAAFLAAAAVGGEVRFSGIEVKAPADSAAKGTARGMAPGVTVRGEGTAGEAGELQWSAVLGAGAAWQPVAGVTVGDDGFFSLDVAGKPGFYRMAFPGQVPASVSKGGTGASVRAAVLNRPTEILSATNIVRAFDTSFYVEATLKTAVLNGSGRSGQPLAGKPVKFAINGGTWTQNTDENGKVRFGPFVDWPIRTSTGTIRFEGAQGLSPCSQSVTVAITKGTPKITLSSTNLVVGITPERKLTIWLKDARNAGLTNQIVKMLINGKTFTLRTDAKGRVTWTADLRAGLYNARISFAGSATHKAASKTVKLRLIWAVQIGAPDKTFNISDRKKAYTTTFKDYQGKALAKRKIQIKIDGKIISAKTNAKGQYTCHLANLGVKKGSYRIVVYFNGGNGYFALHRTATVTVVTSQATRLAVPDETYFSGATNKTYTAYLRAPGGALEKETLTFTIDGKTYAKKTDTQGRATLRLPALETGTHKITVKYAGRGGYKASKKSATVAIRNGGTLPMLTARNKTYGVNAADRLYTATLKTPDGRPLANETVTFEIKGKTWTRTSKARGHALFTLPKLAKGVYGMTVKFPGNDQYPAKTQKVKITIQ